VKLSGLALVIVAATAAAGAAGPRGNIVFAGRNLHTWTSYTGVDPESNYSTGDTPTDFITQPPKTYFTVRLNLRY